MQLFRRDPKLVLHNLANFNVNFNVITTSHRARAPLGLCHCKSAAVAECHSCSRPLQETSTHIAALLSNCYHGVSATFYDPACGRRTSKVFWGQNNESPQGAQVPKPYPTSRTGAWLQKARTWQDGNSNGPLESETK